MKTFVLGVGAQKAGTTWLHRYLDGFEFSNFGLLKEYHVWDAVLGESLGYQVAPHQIFKINQWGDIKARDRGILRYAMQHFEGVYEGYFNSLCDAKHRLTGDITPSYGALDAEAFIKIGERLEGAGFTLKVVFLMRDPVERCWSAVRMSKNMAANPRASDSDQLALAYRKQQVSVRTNYHNTIGRIERAFSSDQIYYGIYENMFEPGEIDRLSEFIGVPANHDAVTERYNAVEKNEQLDDDLITEIQDFYGPVYDFCNERFPVTRELWR